MEVWVLVFILVNRADEAEGFFYPFPEMQFATEKMCKRVALEVTEPTPPGVGNEWQWSCRKVERE